MIWKLRAAWHLYTEYDFDWDDAWELATVLCHNEDSQLESPIEYVDEEMSYWGE